MSAAHNHVITGVVSLVLKSYSDEVNRGRTDVPVAAVVSGRQGILDSKGSGHSLSVCLCLSACLSVCLCLSVCVYQSVCLSIIYLEH